MKIKKTFTFLFGLIISLMLILSMTMLLLLNNQKKLLKSQAIRHNSYLIGNELHQSSDDLTLYCRMFVMTGDSTWETKYWKTLQIRNGEIPRPDGKQIALRDSMQNLGFTKHEFDLLSFSEKNSNELVWTEKVAFNAYKGNFPDSSGIFSIKDKPDIKYAQKIMFDEEYLLAKKRIMEPIKNFTVAINKRNIETVNGYIKIGYFILILSLSLIFVVIIISFISYQLIKKKLDEQIKVELALISSHEELANAKIKAEESDRLKSAFLANMSHEIRTPMNGILGFAELLKESNLTGEKQQKYISIIERGGARMLNIINDIVDISRIESGIMEVNLKESNINDQMEYIYTFFKPEVEKKGMELSFKNSLPTKEAIINTDQEKFYAVLINLVKNAIKYSHKGSIEFGYNKKEKNLEFYVKDTGIGIPKDRQAAIFERFIQADISDIEARQGAGLGLSISKSYIEMLGGKIWVESKEGKSSCFYFTIPYNVVPKQKVVDEKISVTGIDSLKLNLKILIAEDDETSSQLMSIIVDEYSREIIAVRSGEDAVEAYHNNTDIDLVLMDIQLPGMTGYEATRQIRKFNDKVIIIAQTAFGLTGDREKSIAVGCNDYISKPIDKDKLLALIQKYFKK